MHNGQREVAGQQGKTEERQREASMTKSRRSREHDDMHF